MTRMPLALIGAVLLFAAWSVGHAQGRVADFELTIDAPAGEVKATCARGCDWPATPGEKPQVITYRCQRQPCRLIVNGRGRIAIGQPLN